MKCGYVAMLAVGWVMLGEVPVSAQKGGKGGEQAARYGWLSSLQQGKAEALRTGKPLMVVLRCVP